MKAKSDHQSRIVKAISAMHDGEVAIKPGLDSYVDALYGLQDIARINNEKRIINFRGHVSQFTAPTDMMLETLRHVLRALPIESIGYLPTVDVDDDDGGDGEITLTWFISKTRCTQISIFPGSNWCDKVLASTWVDGRIKTMEYYAADYHALREFWHDYIDNNVMED